MWLFFIGSDICTTNFVQLLWHLWNLMNPWNLLTNKPMEFTRGKEIKHWYFKKYSYVFQKQCHSEKSVSP